MLEFENEQQSRRTICSAAIRAMSDNPRGEMIWEGVTGTSAGTHNPHGTLIILASVRRNALLTAAAAPLDRVRVQVEAA